MMSVKKQSSTSFKKLRFPKKIKMNVVNDVGDPFKELNESLKELQKKDPSLVPENMAVQDVAEADGQVITSAPFLTDELILEEVSVMDKDDETNDLADNGDDVNEEAKAPGSSEVEHSPETLKNYYLFSKNRGCQFIAPRKHAQKPVCKGLSENLLKWPYSLSRTFGSVP